MGDNTLTTFASVAGVAGIGLGVVLTIYKQAIQEGVLHKLPEEKAYRILRLVIVLTFLTGVLGVAAWLVEAYINHDGEQLGQKKKTEPLSTAEHSRAIILADKGCFFYKYEGDTPVFIDEGVQQVQYSYMSNLRAAGKGFKFLIYGEVAPINRSSLDYLKHFEKVENLTRMLDLPSDVPVRNSKFVSMSGSVGDYECGIRVVGKDYEGE